MVPRDGLRNGITLIHKLGTETRLELLGIEATRHKSTGYDAARCEIRCRLNSDWI
jgi:hypothetical protein